MVYRSVIVYIDFYFIDTLSPLSNRIVSFFANALMCSIILELLLLNCRMLVRQVVGVKSDNTARSSVRS